MEDVTLRLGGLAQNLDDPARRNVTINVEGLATGVWATEPEVAQALGTRIDLFADAALPPGGPISLRQLQVSGNGLSIFSAGQIENFVYTGRSAIRVADLAIFAGLADRTLAGAVDLHADGSVTPLSGGFDLAVDGSARDLALGDPRLDRLLAGETTLSGRAVRDEAGIRTDDLRLENSQFSFASNGQISSTRSDIGFDASLSDLALLDPRVSGSLTASGRASGQGRPIAVSPDRRGALGDGDRTQPDRREDRLRRRGRRHQRDRQPERQRVARRAGHAARGRCRGRRRRAAGVGARGRGRAEPADRRRDDARRGAPDRAAGARCSRDRPARGTRARRGERLGPRRHRARRGRGRPGRLADRPGERRRRRRKPGRRARGAGEGRRRVRIAADRRQPQRA